MNPERITHENPALTNVRDQLENPATATGELVDARRLLVQRKAELRGARGNNFLIGMWRRISRQRPLDSGIGQLERNYDAVAQRTIALNTRMSVDPFLAPGTPDAAYRNALAMRAALLAIGEKATLVNAEIGESERRRGWFDRTVGQALRNPWVRSVVGIGLNVATGAAILGGALPFAAALVAARVGLGAMGMEGAMSGLANRFMRGNRGEVTPAQAATMTMPEIQQRIAAFTERRITDRNPYNINVATGLPILPPGSTEGILFDRYAELIEARTRTQLAGVGVENWMAHQQDSDDAEQVRQDSITERDNAQNDINTTLRPALEAATTALTTREGERDAAIAARDAAQTARDTAEAARAAAETARDNARTNVATLTHYLTHDTGHGGVLNPTGNAATADTLLQRHHRAVEEITRLESVTPRPVTLIRIQDDIRTRTRGDLMTEVSDVDAAVDAYAERQRERGIDTAQEHIRSTQETERDNQETIRIAQETNRVNAENDITVTLTPARTAAQTALDNREADRVAAEHQIPAAEDARDQSRELTRNQAIMVHDILRGGDGLLNGERILPAQADGGILGQDFRSREGLNAMNNERNARFGRWAIALAASGLLTLLTNPITETLNFNGVDPQYANVPGLNGQGSSLWGQAEAAYLQVNPVINPNTGLPVDPRNFADSEYFNRFWLPQNPGAMQRLAEYHAWATTNNGPENFWTDPATGRVRYDIIRHGVDFTAPNPQTFFQTPNPLEQGFRSMVTRNFDANNPTAGWWPGNWGLPNMNVNINPGDLGNRLPRRIV